MFRFIVVLVAAPAYAQSLPSPALVGTGQSTQTLELAKEIVTVTVDSGGSFNTRDGTASGGLSVGVNGFELGVGNPDAGATPEHAEPAPRSDFSANGPEVNMSAGQLATDDAACMAGIPVSVAEIAQIDAGSRVIVQRGWEGPAMSDSGRAAVAGNAALSGFLEHNGLRLEDLISVAFLTDQGVLVLSVLA